MATGALNAQSVWIYGEDDSEATFSALLNKLGTSVSSNMKGRIAQVVHNTYSISTASATSTYIDTGLSATITPTKADSQIIAIVNQAGIVKNSSNDTFINLRLNRGATVLRQIESAGLAFLPVPSFIGIAGVGINFVETAGSTTARTYKTMFMSATNLATVNVQFLGSTSSITLLEVTA